MTVWINYPSSSSSFFHFVQREFGLEVATVEGKGPSNIQFLQLQPTLLVHWDRMGWQITASGWNNTLHLARFGVLFLIYVESASFLVYLDSSSQFVITFSRILLFFRFRCSLPDRFKVVFAATSWSHTLFTNTLNTKETEQGTFRITLNQPCDNKKAPKKG